MILYKINGIKLVVSFFVKILTDGRNDLDKARKRKKDKKPTGDCLLGGTGQMYTVDLLLQCCQGRRF